MPKINKADIELLREQFDRYQIIENRIKSHKALKSLRASIKKIFGTDADWAELFLGGLFILDDTYPEPNETYYKVFEALGYEITEDN